jgi:transposase-like protein
VREDGVIHSQAVLIAIGVDWEGRRNVLQSNWPTGNR